MTKRVFLAGGTGNQGGSVVNALLDRDHHVVTLARETAAAEATKLAGRGVEVLSGDMADPAALGRAMQGANVAYVMTTPFEVGVDGEVEMGRTMLDAAKANGVAHVILSSVGGADTNTGIPHFDSKYKVELHARELGLPVTISAPVYFMDNIVAPWAVEALKSGVFAMALSPGRPLQQVAVRNIGEFAAALIERGEQVFGERYDIAGDELTGTDAARHLSSGLGVEIKFAEQPIAEVRAQSEDMALMLEWFDSVGYSADIKGLRHDFPEVNWLSFADWAATQSL